MKLNWQGHGQKHYDFNGGYLRLEWDRIDGENIYSLLSRKESADAPTENEIKILLSFCIPDFSWQDTEPSFFPFRRQP